MKYPIFCQSLLPDYVDLPFIVLKKTVFVNVYKTAINQYCRKDFETLEAAHAHESANAVRLIFAEYTGSDNEGTLVTKSFLVRFLQYKIEARKEINAAFFKIHITENEYRIIRYCGRNWYGDPKIAYYINILRMGHTLHSTSSNIYVNEVIPSLNDPYLELIYLYDINSYHNNCIEQRSLIAYLLNAKSDIEAVKNISNSNKEEPEHSINQLSTAPTSMQEYCRRLIKRIKKYFSTK